MSSPAASDETEFVFPYKPVEGPLGDCMDNVLDYERLNAAVEATTIEYAEELFDGYVEQVEAEIVADTMYNLNDWQ